MIFGIPSQAALTLFVMFVVGPAIIFIQMWIQEWITRRQDARFYRAEYLRLRNENLQLSRQVANMQPPF